MAAVVTLILAGATLMLLETVLPGMIAGIIGFGCVVCGVVMAYWNFEPQTANLVLLAVLVGLTAGTMGWFKYFPESRVARLFISRGTIGSIGTDRPELLGQSGTTVTVLRPSGTALIDGKRVDVVTEGPFVERGAVVKVVEVEGLRVVVRMI
jgi:membrane-bound serine protease (ClpP class)